MKKSIWSGLLAVAALCGAAADAQAGQKILVLGDVYVGTGASSDYALAAQSEMVAAAVAKGGLATDVTYVPYNGTATTLDANTFKQPTPAGGRYDIVVVTAVWGGMNPASVAALQTAISTRAADAFFLFPDQCSSCASNIENITKPIVNAATGWGISTGALFDDSRVNIDPNVGKVALNTLSSFSQSFSTLNPMNVWDYQALDGVPARNALYFPQAPEFIALPTAAQMQANTPMKDVAALIVPQSQSFNGQGACIFTISDVNTLTSPGNPPTGTLGGMLMDAKAGSCSVPVGGVTVTKTLAAPPAGAAMSWPVTFQFNATCDKPIAGTVYPSGNLSFSAAGVQSIDIGNIPAGANCTVSEVPPASPANYDWIMPPAQSATIAANTQSPVSFENRLLGQPGTIRINKQLTMPVGVTGNLNLSFGATCNVGGQTVTLPAVSMAYPSVNSVDITNVPADAQCTVTETLPTAPPGFSWDTSQGIPATVTSLANGVVPVPVTNVLKRNFVGIALSKSVTGGPAAGVTGTFKFNAHCTYNGGQTQADFPGQVILAATNSGQGVIANVPEGASCVVTEDATSLPAAPANYSWGAAPQSVTLAAVSASSTASFTNTLTRLLASIDLKTTVVGGPTSGPSSLFNGSFNYAIDCGADGKFSGIVNLSASNSGSTSVVQVPQGAQCRITQSAPQPNAPQDFHWDGTPADVNLTVAASGNTASFENKLVSGATAQNATSVPTLSQWALMMLSVALAGMAASGLRRKTLR